MNDKEIAKAIIVNIFAAAVMASGNCKANPPEYREGRTIIEDVARQSFDIAELMYEESERRGHLGFVEEVGKRGG